MKRLCIKKLLLSFLVATQLLVSTSPVGAMFSGEGEDDESLHEASCSLAEFPPPTEGEASIPRAPSLKKKPKDDRHAVEEKEQAWEIEKQGLATEAFMLGEIYTWGQDGIPVDKRKAFKWYKQAAKLGLQEAKEKIRAKPEESESLPGASCSLFDTPPPEFALAEAAAFSKGRSLAEAISHVEEREKAWERARKRLAEDASQFSALYQWGLGGSLGLGYKNFPRDKSKAFKWIKQIAKLGLKETQEWLGYIYLNGDEFVKKDEKKAFKWLKEAAKQGMPHSQYRLGYFYQTGEGGVVQDEQKAFKWYKLAAEQQYDGAQYKLAYCYLEGRGVAQDDQKAFEWYSLATQESPQEVQYDIGCFYLDGKHCKQNNQKAFELFSLAAEKGHKGAQHNLGCMYMDSIGVVQDEQKAFELFSLAAAQGVKESEFAVGRAYEYGKGVSPPDCVVACEWYKRAAEKGLKEAQYALGWHYLDGGAIAPNDQEAMRWFQAAAKQGSLGAQEDLRWMYFNDRGGPELRELLLQLVQDPGYYYLGEAIQVFLDSNKREDQELRVALLIRLCQLYFPDDLAQKITQFNQDTFKAHARKPLADLSAEPMNLTREFALLIDQINPDDEASSFYLQAAAVTGEEADATLEGQANTERFWEIALKAMGFLKTLEGKELAEGEERGWQMYAENKPALINSLKHIVCALKKEDDPRTRVNNLGVVLNGICYCPTGQTEGINSAVNTLIYKQNRSAESVEDRIHALVQEAVYQAFLSASDAGDSNVLHRRSRLRMVLQVHIGLSQAVEGYIERISYLTDEEIPLFFEDFYRVFTKDLLAEYLVNHAQTLEDFDLWMAYSASSKKATAAAAANALNSPTKETDVTLQQQIKNNKQARPLLMGDLMAWFADQGLADRLEEFGFDVAEGRGVLNPIGALAILEKLRYIAAPPPPSQPLPAALAEPATIATSS